MQVLIAAYLFLVASLVWAEFKNKKRWQYWLKPMAAIGFILIAILGGALYWGYGQWIVYGLVTCALGDICLLSRTRDYVFKLGMLAFGIGHFCYLTAFIIWTNGVSGLNVWSALPVAVGAGFLFWLKPKLPHGMSIPVTIYGFLIIVMVIRSLDVGLWMVPVAAILFALSDMFVAKDRFIDKYDGAKTNPNALIITPLYFSAQLLFALSAAI